MHLSVFHNRFRFVIAILLAVTVVSCAQGPVPTQPSRSNASEAHQELNKREQSAADGPAGAAVNSPSRGTVPVSTGKRPPWIDGDNRQYPQKDYLTGVGYGSDRDRAEDNARKEISKIFYTSVQSKSRIYQQYLQTEVNSPAATRETLNIEEITEVTTRKVLHGVRIAQVYQTAGAKKEYYALAVLDRQQAQRSLSDQIQALDDQIGRLLTEADTKDDTLTKVKLLTRSLEFFLQRQLFDAELRIVDPSGTGIAPKTTFADIHSQLSKTLLRGFWIGVSIDGSRAADIQQALIEAFNSQGFSVISDIGKAHVLAKGSANISPIDQGPSQWKFVRWKVHFNLIDQKGGAAFGSVTKTGKEGHLTLSQAEERAIQKIRKTMAPEIAEQLTHYIFDQAAQSRRSN